MELPQFFVVGDRPVTFVATADGGMDVLALDWRTGALVREMGYLSRCLSGDPEVDEVDEAEWEARVAKVRRRLEPDRLPEREAGERKG